ASSPEWSEDELIGVTASIFHALLQAHSMKAPTRVVHGGGCPAVLLRTEEGGWEVTEFGVGPAILHALGVESYLNLAVGSGSAAQATNPSGVPDGVTGLWEVLSPDVVDREDRLCGFIDPERYFKKGDNPDFLKIFEPGSDVNAAGIVI